MTLSEAVDTAVRRLERAGVGLPRLDAQVLLLHAMGVDRSWALSRPSAPVPDDARARFERLVRRRAKKEPVAYLTGVKEFYSLEFKTDPRALVPRPETEGVVDEALASFGDTPIRAVDIGCGCGAIAVTLALRRPRWRLTAVDTSPGALALSRENASRHGVAGRIRFVESDLFDALGGERFDLIVSNPPYVAEGSPHLAPEVAAHEPAGALFAGPGGLDVIKRLVDSSPARLNRGGRLIIEFGAGQAAGVAALVTRRKGLALERIMPDLQGIERIAVAMRRDG